MHFLFVVLMALAVNADKPKLVTRVFPAMQTVNLARGCSEVIMTAEIKGIEDEKWYCPKVEWEGLGSEESDCVPFEQRYQCFPKPGPGCDLDWHIDSATGATLIDKNPCDCNIPGYPRIWRRRLCAPEHPTGGMWTIVVKLTKNGAVIARDEIRFMVK